MRKIAALFVEAESSKATILDNLAADYFESNRF